METLEYIRNALENAPAKGIKTAPDLLGNWLADGHYVCAKCIGRMLARGCSLPKGATLRPLSSLPGRDRMTHEQAKIANKVYAAQAAFIGGIRHAVCYLDEDGAILVTPDDKEIWAYWDEISTGQWRSE
jgi:hypothetical protein